MDINDSQIQSYHWNKQKQILLGILMALMLISLFFRELDLRMS